MKLLAASVVAAAMVEMVLCGLQVVTEGGRIQGIGDATINGKTFNAFYSIPYARPPIGNYRFKVRVYHTVLKPFETFSVLVYFEAPPSPTKVASRRCFHLPGNAYCCNGSLVCV